ncbi:hypothetical protein ACQKBO_00505 [Helicobacter pylori]
MLKAFLQSIIKELAEFEIFFKMTKQSNQKPVFKNKSFSNRAKNSVIKKFKNSNAF